MNKEKTIVFSILLLSVGILVYVGLLAARVLPLDTIYGKKLLAQREKDINVNSVGDMFSETDEDADEGRVFKIGLYDGVTRNDVDVSMDYMHRILYIDVEGVDGNYFMEHPLSGSSSNIDDMLFVERGTGAGYEITLNDIYEPVIDYSKDTLTLTLKYPRDVYDYLVVIDPGHGGSDSPGTVWGGVKEESLVLAVGMDIYAYKDELNAEGIGIYMTRTEDEYVALYDRSGFANDLGADLFISLHLNSLDGYESQTTSGVEALYSQSDDTKSSKRLAKILVNEVSDILGARNRGLVEGDDIAIVRDSKVPVALLEGGFMSNSSEFSKLQSDEYQKRMAAGVVGAIRAAREEGIGS